MRGYVRVLHTGMVVCPGVLEAMGEFFDRLGLLPAVQDQESGDGSAKRTQGKDEVFHGRSFASRECLLDEFR